MSDFGGWDVAKVLWGILVTLLSWLGVRSANKVDEIEDDVTLLRSTAVTRDELEAYRKFHQQQLDELRESLTATTNLAVERLERSNGKVIEQVQKTQNIILEKMLRN